MEKENSLCNKILNKLKRGSNAFPEGIEKDIVAVKEKNNIGALTRLSFVWMDRKGYVSKNNEVSEK